MNGGGLWGVSERGFGKGANQVDCRWQCPTVKPDDLSGAKGVVSMNNLTSGDQGTNPIRPLSVPGQPTPVARPAEPRPSEPAAAPAHGAPAAAPGQAASKIQLFEQRMGAKRHEDKWQRTPNLTGTGAIHVKSFHCKLIGDTLEFLDQQINEWLDAHPQYEVKFVTSTIGDWTGKVKEPNLIVQVWV